jgi:LytS/YehU family sensor histidine kinase
MILYVAGGFAFFVQGLAINCAFYVVLRRGAQLRQRGLELAEVRERAARAEVAAAQAEAAASNARLAALRYQLNPHFLFNTLNAISSMVVTDRNEAAEGMLTRLSEFLRSTLASKPDALVPIEDELASLANYLEIESFRLRDRLNFEVDCPPSLAEVPVPSFILQPLVENAIKHGVAMTSRPVTITVRVACANGTMTIEVRDTGGDATSSIRASGFGLGLDNVRERLRSVYGPGASLTTECLQPGFAVTLYMPVVEARTLAAA